MDVSSRWWFWNPYNTENLLLWFQFFLSLFQLNAQPKQKNFLLDTFLADKTNNKNFFY